MEEEQLLKDIYCTKCQAVTPHTAKIDGNGEFVFECTVMETVSEEGKPDKEVPHHFVKFPADTDPEIFNDLVAKHEEQNVGQVRVEVQQEKLRQLLGISLKPVEEVEEEPAEE
jgi:hypothetical protein